MSLKAHQSASMQSDVWLTPRHIVERLGNFDLDPCSIDSHPWQIAPTWYTKERDGLSQPWFGRVWLNPPFGQEKWLWMARLAEHGNGIALIPACTETAGFFATVWRCADAICFLEGRPHFHRADGTRGHSNSGAPIVLIAYGAENALCLMGCNLGKTIKP